MHYTCGHSCKYLLGGAAGGITKQRFVRLSFVTPIDKMVEACHANVEKEYKIAQSHTRCKGLDVASPRDNLSFARVLYNCVRVQCTVEALEGELQKRHYYCVELRVWQQHECHIIILYLRQSNASLMPHCLKARIAPHAARSRRGQRAQPSCSISLPHLFRRRREDFTSRCRWCTP